MKLKYYSQKYALVVFLFLCCNFLHSQSILEQLGAIKVNFELTTGKSVSLNNSSQILIERAVSQFDASTDASYGFAYKAWHLEFQSTKEIKKVRESGTRRRNVSVLKFYNEEGTLLASVDILRGHISYVTNDEAPSVFTYSINLKEIPLIILEETARINIRHVDKRRF